MEELHIRCWVAEDPMSCVARGAGMILEHYDALKRLLVGLRARQHAAQLINANYVRHVRSRALILALVIIGLIGLALGGYLAPVTGVALGRW